MLTSLHNDTEIYSFIYTLLPKARKTAVHLHVSLLTKLEERCKPHEKMLKQKRQRCLHDSWRIRGKALVYTDVCQATAIFS